MCVHTIYVCTCLHTYIPVCVHACVWCAPLHMCAHACTNPCVCAYRGCSRSGAVGFRLEVGAAPLGVIGGMETMLSSLLPCSSLSIPASKQPRGSQSWRLQPRVRTKECLRSSRESWSNRVEVQLLGKLTLPLLLRGIRCHQPGTVQGRDGSGCLRRWERMLKLKRQLAVRLLPQGHCPWVWAWSA